MHNFYPFIAAGFVCRADKYTRMLQGVIGGPGGCLGIAGQVLKSYSSRNYTAAR
jgi:hypothetical protein